MTSFSALLQRIEAEAQLGDMSIDRAVYEEVGRETTAPVLLGSGSFVQEWVFWPRSWPDRNRVE